MNAYEKILNVLERINIIPIIDWLTRIDDRVRNIESKLIETIDKHTVEIARVQNINVSYGEYDILHAEILKYKTKTLTIKVDTPMTIKIYLYDSETDLDRDDVYKEIDSSQVVENKTITFTFSDIYKFIRVVVKNEFDVGMVVLCSLKGSMS
ncbi:MAG: hypothetical protein QW795_07265 [Candidatus Bathyarchaeia archaeon]